jgi:rRNA maturation protein Nop10
MDQLTVCTRLEEGFVISNGYLHAAERTLEGLCAFCGAGKIVTLVPGRFNPDDRRACPICAGFGAAPDAVIFRLV